jgi:tetratricopeptide (TPR) repeat protein
VNTRGKKIILSLLPALLLTVLVMAAEILLELFSPPSPGALVTEASYDGIQWYSVNRSALEKYFPASTPIIPELKPALFRKVKTKGLIRVMCLGESSMFGTPYEMTATIPGMLRKQLRHLSTGTEFEVVNWAASAINTNVILHLARRIADFEPDAVVIYTGHNEFYGPDGVGAGFLEQRFPSLTQLKYSARDLRLMHSIQSWMKGASPSGKPGEESNLMRQVSRGSRVRLESEESARIFRLFEHNLRGITEVFRSRGIPVIVSDVSSNLLFPPFESDSVRINGGAEALREAYQAGRYLDLIQKGVPLLETDSSNADVNYWVGKACLSSGDARRAKEFLERARDNDLLKFRAPSQINRIIRKVSMEEGCTFFSADSLLASVSPGGIQGETVFWEHLHPKAFGYYLIASRFADLLAAHFTASPPGLRARTQSFLPFQPDSLSICWLDLAYADLSIGHLTGKWPFQNYHTAPVVLQGADGALRQIVEDVYSRKLGWDDGCYRSATLFWSRGAIREARTTYEALLEEYPYQYYARYLLGSLLNHTGDRDGSVEQYRIAIRSNPSYLEARLDLGLVEVNRGNFEEAQRQLDTVLAGGPGRANVPPDMQATALYGLAAVHANRGEFTQGLSCLDEALRLHPGYRDALLLRQKIEASAPK